MGSDRPSWIHLHTKSIADMLEELLKRNPCPSCLSGSSQHVNGCELFRAVVETRLKEVRDAHA